METLKQIRERSVDANDVSSRVINIFDVLLDCGIVSGPQDFCNRIGYFISSFLSVKAGLRKFPLSRLQDISATYGVRADYLLTGDMPIFEPFIKFQVIRNAQVSITNNIITIRCNNGDDVEIIRIYVNK